MKSLKIFIAIAAAAFFVSCSNDDDDSNEVVLSEGEIPACIITYKTEHFPDNTLTRVTKKTELGVITYEAYLTGNFDLDFNANCEIIDIDGTTKLPDTVIPQTVLDYVAQNYPNQFIISWEIEFNHQQIELNNRLELEFKMDGTFIRIDMD